MDSEPIAIHFGPPGRQLYGVYHPAADGGRRRAVVVCPPLCNEYQRAHRAVARLAAQLSAQGFDALRFDWSGTGDSWGSLADVSTDTWLEDVGLAVEEARRRARSLRADVVGLRLGATLAVLGAGRLDRVDRLVIWEPIVCGATFIADAVEEQRDLWSRLPGVPSARTAPDVEVYGYDYPSRLVASIEAMNLTGTRPRGSKILVLSSAREAIDQLQAAWESTLPWENRTLIGPSFWRGDAEKAVVAMEPLHVIATWLLDGRG
jgi:alpha-beta hydrolase superfamily lysophospholipase